MVPGVPIHVLVTVMSTVSILTTLNSTVGFVLSHDTSCVIVSPGW
jgi:hypothetical protein